MLLLARPSFCDLLWRAFFLLTFHVLHGPTASSSTERLDGRLSALRVSAAALSGHAVRLRESCGVSAPFACALGPVMLLHSTTCSHKESKKAAFFDAVATTAPLSSLLIITEVLQNATGWIFSHWPFQPTSAAARWLLGDRAQHIRCPATRHNDTNIGISQHTNKPGERPRTHAIFLI